MVRKKDYSEHIHKEGRAEYMLISSQVFLIYFHKYFWKTEVLSVFRGLYN